jgi:hypothetical protein
MELFTKTISFLLLIALIIIPIFLFVAITRRFQDKYIFVTYILTGLILTACIILTFAWWNDKANEILLKHYSALSFNTDFGTYQYSLENVKTENINRVEQLKIMYFGIGWPLKAIMSFVFYSPYLIIVYILGYAIREFKKTKSKLSNRKWIEK